MGGVVAEVGDLLYDGSLKHQIDSLKARLTEGA
jgi:F0F1-type ATP synthase delta subunit